MNSINNQKTRQVRQHLQIKIKKLEDIISSMNKVLIAFSGGTDSTFILKFCRDKLSKDQVIALTASSEIIPTREVEKAKEIAGTIDTMHHTISFHPLKNIRFTENSPLRCYHCKNELYGLFTELAKTYGDFLVIDGANKDDENDFRPGQKAATELGVRSPLLEAGLTKDDIRFLSKLDNLPTWDKPAMACLASRFPYGEEITRQKLQRVERAEEIISGLGAKQVRVRFHNDKTARIEVADDQIDQFAEQEKRLKIVSELQKLGFMYIAIDLKGYQKGSMNEILKEGQ